MRTVSKDWWPSLLFHIPKEAPWRDDHVVVAEIKSFDEKPHAGIRRTFAALVPVDDLKAVAAALANLDHNVCTSGPHPSYFKDSPYLPCFRIDAVDLPSKHYDPLILSWASHDLTVLQPDPGFLMTYGLMPRAGKEGFVHWDDPKEPRHDIVIATPPSRWNWRLRCVKLKLASGYAPG